MLDGMPVHTPFISLILVQFLNSLGRSEDMSNAPLTETFFHPINSTKHGSPPPLITRPRTGTSITYLAS